MPVFHWLIMYFTNTFYPAYLAGRFFELAGRIQLKETTEGLDSNFSLPAYFAITNLRTWMEINLIMPLMRLSRILMEGRAFKVLGLFLIGIYAGRQILENNLLSNTRLIKKIMWWGLVIGLPMNLLRTWVEFGLHRPHLKTISFLISNEVIGLGQILPCTRLFPVISNSRQGNLNYYNYLRI